MARQLTPAQLVSIARQHLAEGRLTQADDLCRQIVRTNPQFPQGLHLAGVLAEKAGRLDAAVGFLRRALDAAPENAELQAELARLIRVSRDRTSGASATLVSPVSPPILQSAKIHLAEGVMLQRRRDPDAAMAAYRAALAIDPHCVPAINNLSLALMQTGQLDEALEWARRAVSLEQNASNVHSNLLYLLHFLPASDAASIYREHLDWRRRYNALIGIHAPPMLDDPMPDRRLRIGYVSANLNLHPVGRFVAAFIPWHDREKFEIVCYSGVHQPDFVTEKIRHHANGWVDTNGLSDTALADRIVADRIDILIDLTLHMADSRLLTFARKPAPIQMTYLGYCSTTGLETIDYRITDPWLDPPGGDDRFYAERSIRLPRSYWCYEPGMATPEVNPLPALSRGQFTFASLNNFCKVTPEALRLWSGLLREVPGSRLLIHAQVGQHRQRVLDLFVGEGVASDRVEFFDLLPLSEYFELHHAIDLALDPFPYVGGTTTCDALWMGVPTVSLVGQPAFTRGGLSILSNVGLPEFAVDTHEQYLKIATELAMDPPRLATLRAGMRDRMRQSPLMDGKAFVQNLEDMFRSAWKQRRDRADAARMRCE